MVSNFLPVLLVLTFARKVWSLQCYECDTKWSPSCGSEFKAHQFDTVLCPEEGGIQPLCGKQVQPADESNGGWIGIIRSCYIPGTVLGLNTSNGCQDYHIEDFHAVFCFCDTDYCNHATPSTSSLFFLGKDTATTGLISTLVILLVSCFHCCGFDSFIFISSYL